MTKHGYLRPAVGGLTAVLFLQACAPSHDADVPETAADVAAAGADRVSLDLNALASLELTYARAEFQELVPTLEVPAELVPVPDRKAEVGARVSGRIVEVRVNTGDRVSRGDPLVVLESAEVGRAWADLVSARAMESVAARARDRQRQLLQGRVTSVRAAEEAQGAWEVADAELRAALTRLAALGVYDAGPPPPDPARVTLASPVGGAVTARSAHQGAWVEPSDVLVQVVDLDELWLEASVYEQQMRFVDEGQAVQVEVRAFPGEVFQGSVGRIPGVLDERTRSIGVRIVLPNRDHRLRPGMFATARIQATHAHEARRLLAIPWSAVQEVDGHQAVFVRVGEGEFELRTVHTAERAGELVEILTGLEPGDEVVADGSFLLKGQLLRSTLAEEEG